MDSFPNLPKDPAPTTPAPSTTARAAKAKAAKSANLMYIWIGLAVAGFGGIGYWGMLRPNPSDADPVPHDVHVPEAKTAAQRAEEDALTEMVKRLKEQQDASRVIVLEGPRPPAPEPKPDAAPRPANDMIIKFTPATQPSTRPTMIGGRTKPFLAPDIAEDGSFFGQIDEATGKPKTVYSSNLGKYVVDSGVDFADRDESGAVIERSYAAPVRSDRTVDERRGAAGGNYLDVSSQGRSNFVKNTPLEYRKREIKSIRTNNTGSN